MISANIDWNEKQKAEHSSNCSIILINITDPYLYYTRRNVGLSALILAFLRSQQSNL